MIKCSLFTLMAVFGFLLISALFAAPALASETVTNIPQLEVRNLNQYAGKYLTVYYGIGNRPMISFSNDEITLREVKFKRTLPITANSVTLPQIPLNRSGLSIAYSMAVFVIHGSPNFTWRNTNNSIPDGERVDSPSDSIAIDSLTKNELDNLMTLQNQGKIQYDFGRDIDELLNSLRRKDFIP